MGCIEINNIVIRIALSVVINRNMGCIEMVKFLEILMCQFRLIETWDVLKLFYSFFKCTPLHRLIETWDVLK